jgi:hypothetical protein
VVRVTQSILSNSIDSKAINTRKLIVFAQPAVTYGGYVVNRNGFRPDPMLMRAIREFPCPLFIADIRSFFGLIQQVNHFSAQRLWPHFSRY